MSYADFSQDNLSDFKLNYGNFSYAIFQEANLTGADLTGVKIAKNTNMNE